MIVMQNSYLVHCSEGGEQFPIKTERYLEFYVNKNTYWNIWNIVKTELRDKFKQKFFENVYVAITELKIKGLLFHFKDCKGGETDAEINKMKKNTIEMEKWKS